MSSLGQVITSCKVEAELIPSDKGNIAGGVVGVKDTSSAKDEKSVSSGTLSPLESEDSTPQTLSVFPHIAVQVIEFHSLNC